MDQCIAPKINCKQTAGKKCTDMSAFPIFHSVNMALIFNLGILELLSYILSQILSFVIKKPKKSNAHSHAATIKANLLNGKWKKLTYLIAIE